MVLCRTLDQLSSNSLSTKYKHTWVSDILRPAKKRIQIRLIWTKSPVGVCQSAWLSYQFLAWVPWAFFVRLVAICAHRWKWGAGEFWWVQFGSASIPFLPGYTDCAFRSIPVLKYSLFEYSLIPLALLISGRKFNLPKVAMGGIGSPHEYPIPEK